MKSHFDARVVPSVAYTDPEIAWVGLTEDEAKKDGTAVGVAKFPWAASGRAIANARDEGFTKLIFDAETHRVVGGGIVGTGAGDLICELALAVEMGADATDIGKTIHPASDHQRIGRHGGGGVRGRVHRPAAAEERNDPGPAQGTGAREALKHVVEDAIVGVGSGSTVFKFIDALATIKGRIDGAVAASEASAERLKKHGIRVFDLNSVDELPVYIDGADEITEHLHMIKGGGGALTREKIVAAVARKFVCICDASKLVPVLGKFPLPVEVIPMARSYVGRELLKMGAQPRLRENFTTDNGNLILDCHGLMLLDPPKTESELNQIAGVVTNGIFARRPADVLLLAGLWRAQHYRQKRLIGSRSLSAVAGRLRQRREPARHRPAAAADRRLLRRHDRRGFGGDHRVRALLWPAADRLRAARRPLRPLSHDCRRRAGLRLRFGGMCARA